MTSSVFLALGLALFIGGSPAYAAYTFVNIADGTGPYDGLGVPSVNDSGTAAFFAYMDDGSAAIWRSDGVTSTLIVDNSGELKFSGGGMSLISFPAIANDGTVAFFCYRWFDSNITHGIYYGSGGPVATSAEAEITIVPGAFFDVFSNPGFNENGQISFRGGYYGATENPYGVFRKALASSPYTFTIIADSSATTPFSDLGETDINDAGQVAFHAWLKAGGEGIYLGSAEGAALPIAQSGGAIEYFDYFPRVNNSGTVVFWAHLTDWVDAIMTGSGGPLTTVADTTGRFRQFGHMPGIAEDGTVVFYAEYDDFSRGLFTGPDVDTDKVIGTGDSLFGSTVTGLDIHGNGVSRNGKIAFTYSLEDGRQGIAVALPGTAQPGDCNGDGQLDLDDYAVMASCQTGPNVPYTGCACADIDCDADVDLADFAWLQREFTAP